MSDTQPFASFDGKDYYMKDPRSDTQPDSLTDLVAFLCGEKPLDGLWFGDKPTDGRGEFWWRKPLRKALYAPKPDCDCACHMVGVYAPHKEGHGCCPYAKHFDPEDDAPKPDETMEDIFNGHHTNTAEKVCKTLFPYNEPPENCDCWVAEAAQKLAHHYSERERLARIDEVQRIADIWSVGVAPLSRITNRLAALQRKEEL